MQGDNVMWSWPIETTGARGKRSWLRRAGRQIDEPGAGDFADSETLER
jgi:hypothetical protein